MDLDSEEDYHKYMTALWFWSMNLTSKVFIIWNSYTKYMKQRRLKEAINKSQNSLDWIDDLKAYQEYLKDDDFFQADLFLLPGSFTESTHHDLFKPFSVRSSDSDKEKSDVEGNIEKHSSNEKHESPVTTCMTENLETLGHKLFHGISTSLDGLCLKDAEVNVSLTGEDETAPDKEVGGKEDETYEDSGRSDGSEEGVGEENNVNLIVDVVGNKREDDCFRLQQEVDDDDDDNVINEAYDNQDDSNFDDDIDQEEEKEDDDDDNKHNAKDVDDEDNSKCNGNNDNNEDGCDNIDDDDDDYDDNSKDGADDSDETDIGSKDKVKLLSEENVKAITPEVCEFKGTPSLTMDQLLNDDPLSVLIEHNWPGRQVDMKSNVDSNISVEGDVPSRQDISTQTETVAEEILQARFFPPEKSYSRFTARSHPLATETVRHSGSYSERLVPPDAFHETEKDARSSDAHHSDDATSCNVKAFENNFYFHPIVAKQLKRDAKDARKTTPDARFDADPDSLQFASETPPRGERRNASGFEEDVRQCSSKYFQKFCQGPEIIMNPQNVKWIDDGLDCENNDDIPPLKSRKLPRIPLMAGQFIQLQNNSEDILSQMQFNERSLSGEVIYPQGDIVSRLCSMVNKTRSTCSGQSFTEVLSQSNVIESVGKTRPPHDTAERTISSRDFGKREDGKLDLEHVNDDCLKELEQIRNRLKDFEALKNKLERALETQEQLVEIMDGKILSGTDMHNSLNVQSLLEKLKEEISTLTSRYCREESRCILIAKRAKHLLNEINI